MNKSFFYAICFVVILVVEIIIGIYVRDNFVRPYMGDALVVVLIYCFIRIFIPNGLSQLPLYVLAFACFIEILQYFQLVDVLGISNRMMLNFDFVLRLLVAGILGAIIGLDREYRAKEAGYRTHFLVSLGSALIMIVSQYGFQEIIKENSVTLDPSRVAAQVVSGIGFIGAGTIIFQKQIVRGLTTAAGIWATAGIGLAVGAGMYVIGIAAMVLTLIGLEVLSYLFKSIGMKSSMITFSTDNKEVLKGVADRFNSKDYLIVSYQMDIQKHGSIETYQVTMIIKSKRNNDEGHLLSLIQEFPEVTVERIE